MSIDVVLCSSTTFFYSENLIFDLGLGSSNFNSHLKCSFNLDKYNFIPEVEL